MATSGTATMVGEPDSSTGKDGLCSIAQNRMEAQQNGRGRCAVAAHGSSTAAADSTPMRDPAQSTPDPGGPQTTTNSAGSGPSLRTP